MPDLRARPEPPEEPRIRRAELDHAEGAAVGVGQNRRPAIFGEDRCPAARNLVERLLPTDPLELPGALRSRSPHRIKHPVVGVDAIEIGTYLGAQPPLR